MKGNILNGILIVAVIGIISAMVAGSSVKKGTLGKVTDTGLVATIYKSPSCGCCSRYGAYLEGIGYNVHEVGVEDMSSVKADNGIPYELESCHTMEVGDYIIEGHVPEEAIQRLLTEKLDIKGIGMAGMPSGSPGMPGPKSGDFVIYEILHGGTKGAVFMTL